MELQHAVMQAIDHGTPLRIVGGNSKHFLGREVSGVELSLAGHKGIVNYEPTELVLTARSGTPVREIEAVLLEQNQMIGFDPPRFDESATLGGTVASGLSGSCRPFRGSVRDFVLGTRIINGKGDILSFGGEVMKNVAGYDVSRLMAGAMGTLGVLLGVSMKVLPRPQVDITLQIQMNEAEALETMNHHAARPLPLAGQAWDGETVHIRLAGGERAVASAVAQIGGEPMNDGTGFWKNLREHRLSFFSTADRLWRLSLAPATPRLRLQGEWFYDWSGALRWLVSSESPAAVFEQAALAGGHATLFRGTSSDGCVFQPLGPELQKLNRSVKQSLDPHGLFNRYRMYPDW